MDFAQLKELLHLVNESELKEFELDTDQLAVRMSKNDYPSYARLTSIEGQDAASVTAPQPAEARSEKSPAAASVQSAPETAAVEEVAEEAGHVITAPIVGSVYLAPSPDQPNFKQVGDSVKKGEPLCIIEAMKIMNEIKSDADGVIQKILVEDGQAVEYGQPLFQLKEEEK